MCREATTYNPVTPYSSLNSSQFVEPGFVRFDLERYLRWSTWVACGGNVPEVEGVRRGPEVVGLGNAPDVEAARLVESGVGSGVGADDAKGLIVVSEGGAQEQPGSNIVLGNGGLEELSRIIEEEIKKVVGTSTFEDVEEAPRNGRRRRKFKNPFFVVGEAVKNIARRVKEKGSERVTLGNVRDADKL